RRDRPLRCPPAREPPELPAGRRAALPAARPGLLALGARPLGRGSAGEPRALRIPPAARELGPRDLPRRFGGAAPRSVRRAPPGCSPALRLREPGRRDLACRRLALAGAPDLPPRDPGVRLGLPAPHDAGAERLARRARARRPQRGDPREARRG